MYSGLDNENDFIFLGIFISYVENYLRDNLFFERNLECEYLFSLKCFSYLFDKCMFEFIIPPT